MTPGNLIYNAKGDHLFTVTHVITWKLLSNMVVRIVRFCICIVIHVAISCNILQYAVIYYTCIILSLQKAVMIVDYWFTILVIN